MKSGTTFPGTFSFIGCRETSNLEGLTLLINSTPELLDAPSDSWTRFPLCQLDDF